MSPLFDVLALMLPPGFERKPEVFFQVSPQDIDLSSLTSEQKDIIESCRDKGRVRLSELNRKYGKIKIEKIIEQLVRQKSLIRTEQLREGKVKPKKVSYIKLDIKADEKEALFNKLRKSRADFLSISSLSLYLRSKPIISLRK